MIQITDIKEGAQFKTANGIIWIIDRIEENEKHGTLVHSSMSHGAKGNYRDTIAEVVAFLNEEKAVKEQFTFTRKTYTFQEINEMYNYKKWYVGTFEIESFKKGTKSHYAFAYRKTGDKDKFGGDIYFETGRVYFELIAPFTYQECENPYKKINL